MASGCLMGTCFVCDDLVWEDEWDMVGDRIIHEECKSIAILTDYRDKVDHHHHKRKINEIKEDLENLKHVIKDCEKKIERLEGLIGKDDCMKFYECIKGFCVPKVDGDGFQMDEDFIVEEGTVWNAPEEDENYRLIGGEKRLENDTLGWIEIPNDELEAFFEPIA